MPGVDLGSQTKKYATWTAQAKAHAILQGCVAIVTCTLLRVLLWVPLGMLLGLFIAPLSLMILHLPFHHVPWWKQLVWHYAVVLHMIDMPGVNTTELLARISNWFIPDLEAALGRRDEAFSLTGLPEMSAAQLTKLGTKGFRRKYYDGWVPVKVRSFAKEYCNFEHWSLEKFAEKHGDTKVYVYRNDKKTDIERIKFSELAEKVMREEKVYARAIPQILNQNPKLLDDLPFKEMGEMRSSLLGSSWDRKYATLQFFSAKGTWTQVHADVSCNFNIQFQGCKRWVIFPPSMAMLLYPFAKGTNQFFQSSFDLSNMDLKKYPCLKYVSGYEMVMEPGDMLWLPSWWWHGVENLTTPACAVACDGVGVPSKLFGTNPTMSGLFMFHPSNAIDFLLLGADDMTRNWTI
uniref:JmjC domain-containing protein n=2 Tax=Lotharella globosa TaxID=91324 RepID=A0A6V3J0K0_9EUKA|mmetsp:Transcript_631/g.1233  ORF Transcript_631/g.1233 Transcript_631/m.1233 type:complete len:404 (-) Transcript_631:286-1497(-)